MKRLIANLLSAVWGSPTEPPPGVASTVTGKPSMPTVKFDPSRVTAPIKADLKENIRKIAEFDDTHCDRIYAAALRSITEGGNQAVLFNAIISLDLREMSKRRAGEISRGLSFKAKALMNRDQQLSFGIREAIWVYSGAPCQLDPRKPSAKEIRQNKAHKEADGKRYEVNKGMLLNGCLTLPGREDGCKCISRPIIPGMNSP